MASYKKTIPFVGTVDFSQLHFGAVDNSNNKTRVEIFKDGSSTAPKNRLNMLNLCKDANAPISTRFALDLVRDDGNPNRRGLALWITDEDTLRAFAQLDERIIEEATLRSKEWFKGGKQLTKDQVKGRYKPLVEAASDEDPRMYMKIKIKTGTEKYPTTLHRCDEKTSEVVLHGATVDDLTVGASVVPLVSASYGLWFMMGGATFGLSMQAEEMIVTPGFKDNGDDLSHFASSIPLRVATRDNDAKRAHEDEETGGAKDEPKSKVSRVELAEADDDAPAM